MAQDFCCDCEYLNRKDEYKDWFSSVTKYKCKLCRDYKELTEIACSSIKKIKKDTGSYTPSGCYITTIVCDILGYSDDCALLNILRNFRDTTLKYNPSYLPLLIEYDSIGPIICNHINLLDNKTAFCEELLARFLQPCVGYIISRDVENAVQTYVNMVMYLKDIFGLPNIVINMNQNIDLENVGKGRIRTNPKTSEC